jgi:hypothetical protein
LRTDVQYFAKVDGATTVASNEAKIMTTFALLLLLGMQQKVISISTKMTFTLDQYLRIFYVNELALLEGLQSSVPS